MLTNTDPNWKLPCL